LDVAAAANLPDSNALRYFFEVNLIAFFGGEG
jgi:hypothetical protein